jgi:hypothetical protein
MTSVRYWETPSFRKLQREWTRKLAESGFRDIEQANGLESHADTEAMPVDIELEAATAGRARDALSDEVLWRGLPPKARKFWALVVTLGFDVKPAGRIVGVSRRRAEGWRDEILRRIEG